MRHQPQPNMPAPAAPTAADYPPAYFRAQMSKSDAKIAWQYGRIMGLARAPRLAGRTLVDVGCGSGPALRYSVAHGARAIGLDHSHFALQVAQQIAPRAFVIVNDSTGGLPCASASADLMLLSELVEHVPDAMPLLRECWRVLKPGGRIIITTPNLWDVRRALAPLTGQVWSGDTDPTHINLYTPPRLARELRAAGFAQVRWHTGVKPAKWLSSRRLRMRLALPYPPLIGNGLLATGVRP